MSILTIDIYINIKCKAPRKRLTCRGPRESNDCLPDHAVCAERVEQRIRSSGSVRLRTHRRRDHVQRNPRSQHRLDEFRSTALRSLTRLPHDRGNHVGLVLVEPIGIDSDVVANHAKRLENAVEIRLRFIGNRVEELRVLLEILKGASEDHADAIHQRSDHARIVTVHGTIGTDESVVVAHVDLFRLT